MSALSPTVAVAELQGHARWLGRGFTAVAAAMAASFGWQLGGDSLFAAVVMSAGFFLITVAVSYMLNFIDLAYAAGERKISVGLGFAYLVFLGIEYFSHVGFTVGNRAKDIQFATHKTVTHDDGRKAVADLERELGRMESKHDWQRSYGPAESYRDRIAAAQRAMDLEAARGGCKTACLQLQQALASLTAEQAIAADRVAVTEEIKIAKADLAKARAYARTATVWESRADSQAHMVAQIATGSLQPTAAAMQWANIGIGAYVSLAFTWLGTLFNFLGYHRFGETSRPKSPAPIRSVPAIQLRFDDVYRQQVAA